MNNKTFFYEMETTFSVGFQPIIQLNRIFKITSDSIHLLAENNFDMWMLVEECHHFIEQFALLLTSCRFRDSERLLN